MKIINIKLENFRSYKKYSLDFSNVTILIGQNGIGKTNILEAVWLLSCGRSWRTSRDTETILWEEDYAKITSEIAVEKKNKTEKLELILQGSNFSLGKNQSKLLKINSVKKKLLDLLGQMPAVLFSPESLELIDGSPGIRRKFLDIMLSQVDHRYALNLLEYQKVLRERNKLLYFVREGRAKADELDFWDEKLVDLGTSILEKRIRAVEFLNNKIAGSYQEIAGNDEILKLSYKGSVKPEKFKEEIQKIKNREIESANTLIGPHRDDWKLVLNKRDIDEFGSRGEYRSAVLALKVMEMEFLQNQIGEKPILLLDDIFSEFDASRRGHLAKLTKNVQVIITTTDLDHISQELRKKAEIVELK